MTTPTASAYLQEVVQRLEQLSGPPHRAAIDRAAELIVEALAAGGIVQAFGTGHSQGFVMEIAGRAGGLIPTNGIALRDVVLYGDRDPDVLGATLEREPGIVDELLAATPIHPADVFLIASNSGVNGSIVGMAEALTDRGHKLVAVTSLAHTMAVEPKHPSGKRLLDFADVVIDNLAPYGDTTLAVAAPDGGAPIGVGAVSSMTAAYIAQLITIAVTERIAATGERPPIYISANVPEGDEHNRGLEDRYAGRLRRGG